MCDNDNDDEALDKQLCTIGNRTFPYFPKIGLAPSTAPQFLERTSPKDPCEKKIMYLGFETTVVGYSHFIRTMLSEKQILFLIGNLRKRYVPTEV